MDYVFGDQARIAANNPPPVRDGLVWLTAMSPLTISVCPFSPGRRLKGLWREAYRDVADAWHQCGQSPIPVEQIFGKSGQVSGDGDARIHVANAELKEASSLKEWLEYLQHHKIRQLHSEDVLHYFATVRTQNRC